MKISLRPMPRASIMTEFSNKFSQVLEVSEFLLSLFLIVPQMQQERQAAIDRQNEVILSALMKIKQSPARVDHWKKDWKPRFVN